jgi:thiol-disulfide isomerase/thioredoxin
MDMNGNLIRRRQLLLCLGLGAGVAVTLPHLKQNAPRISTQVSATNLDTQVPEVVAAMPPAGEILPEFQGIRAWLNSAPLTTADLKGNVVLVQFWTFACINCQRTLPYVTRWHQQYASQGLKVIGVHTPEFAFEREENNIKNALQKHQITYPVPIDDEYKTWNAYKNNYWPHLYLADRQGVLQYDHIGEGAYDETEQTIRQLLG